VSPSTTSGVGRYARVLVVWALVLTALYVFQETFR
jgi:hypothetical protein